MKRLAIPFLKYILGPLLVAILSFYLGKKNEAQTDKSYSVLAQALNVQLQDTLNHIDARLNNLDTRMLRTENVLLVYHAPLPAPATQPVAVPPKPPKPVVPTKATPPTPTPPTKALPPAKADTAPGKIVVVPAKAPLKPSLHKAKMQIQVPARLRDL